MKSIKQYFESASEKSEIVNDNESKLGKKIDNIFKKNQTKLNKIIQSRQEHWDSNMTDYAREPMFLIAAPKEDLEVGSHRDYSWVRWKYMKGHRDEIKGTFRNYNIADGEGNKPNSVIGIYYDRHFELINSLDVFYQIYSIINDNYDKYYNNMYESKKDED